MSDQVRVLAQPQTWRRRGDLSAYPAGRPAISVQDGVDVVEQLAVFADGKWLIAYVWFLVMALAGIYLFLVPPTFTADAMLRVDKNRAFLNDPLRGDPRNTEDNSNPGAEVEILRSRSVLRKVVNDLDLTVQVSPHYFPIVGEAIARRFDANLGVAKPWMGLQKYAWGGESIKLARLAVPDSYLGGALTLIALKEGRYSVLGPENEFLGEGRVGVVSEMPVGGSRPLSLLVSELKARPGTYFDVQRNPVLSTVEALDGALTIKESGKDTEIISVEYKGRDPRLLSRAVNDMVTTYVHNTVAWQSAKAKQKLSLLEQQLPMIKGPLDHAEDALNSFRQAHQAVDLSVENGVILKQIADLEIQAIQLRQKQEDVRQLFTKGHPRAVALNSQIAQVDKVLSGLNARVKSLPRTQQEMLRLSREVQVNSELYVSWLNSLHKQRVAAAGTIGNTRVVDYAVVPEKPSWPIPLLVLGIAAVLGLFSGLAAVLLRRTLRRGVDDPYEIESHMGLPVYAMVPHSKQQKRLATTSRRSGREQTVVLAHRHPDDISVESLRMLRATLHTVLGEASNNVLMICSPTVGLGKSFISLNLAAVLASAGKRVLLVDANLRNGRLHEGLALPCAPGLSDLAVEVTSSKGAVLVAAAIVSQTQIPGVDFIAKGKSVPNPSELLMTRHIEDAFGTFKECYDHIIIDTPPVLSVADAAIIGRLAGAIIMVIKEGAHTLQEIELSVKRLQQTEVKPCGFLINDIRKAGSSYRHYRYGYSS